MPNTRSSPEQQAFFNAHPELDSLRNQEFTSIDALQAAAKTSGISLPPNAFQYLLTSPSTEQTESPEAFVEKTVHANGSHQIHLNHHGQQKTINANEAYKNIVQNTVRDWNSLHKDDPSKQVSGKTYLKDNEGNTILNPEIKQKIPQFHEHTQTVFREAFGQKALDNYSQWLETATYKNPKNDPVIKRFEANVRDETGKRIAQLTKERAEKSENNPQIQADERAKIEREIRSNLFQKIAPSYEGKFRSYARRSLRSRLPGAKDKRPVWIRDSWKEYEELKAKQQNELRKLYQTPSRLQGHLDSQTQKAFESSVQALEETDRKRGVTKSRSYYETQVDRAGIEKQVRQEEAEKFHELTRGGRGYAARHSDAGRRLEAEYEALKKISDQIQAETARRESLQKKETDRLAKLRDPKNDTRIGSLRADLQSEMGKLRTQALTNERALGLVQSAGKGSFGLNTAPPAGRTKELASGLLPKDLAGIEQALRQQKYEELFKGMSDKQIRRYTRQDPEIKAAYDRMEFNKKLAKLRSEEAFGLTQKRRLPTLLYHRIRPFKRSYLPLPGELTDTTIKKSRFRRATAQLSAPLDPLRNRYDTSRDALGRFNQKYNPYEIAKRRASRRYSIIRNRISYLNQKYNPYEIAKRRLRKLREELSSTIGYYSKQTLKAAGRFAWQGASSGARAGLGLLGRGAGAALRLGGARLAPAAAGAPIAVATPVVGFFASPPGLAILIGGGLILLFFFITGTPGSTTSNVDGVSAEAGCKTGPQAPDGADIGDPQCQAPKASALMQDSGNKFSLLLHKTFHLTAFAQDTSIDSSDSIGNNNDTSGNVDIGFNPATDVVHRIHISYDKPSKDILVSYPIQNEVTLVAADPAPNEDYKNNPNISFVTWSVKKVLNPGKTAAELQNITLPALPSGGMTFKLTLRPKPGVKDVYIISQAKITLDPISSSGQVPLNSGTSPDTGIGIDPGAKPSTNTCGGSITISNPDGTNFGDPDCNFSVDKLASMLKQQDPENADYWFTTVIPCESPGYDPNLYYRSGAAGDTPDAAGAWGLFQMGRGLNGQYDHGDVAWPQQIINATTYRRNVSWRYWACAESRW